MLEHVWSFAACEFDSQGCGRFFFVYFVWFVVRRESTVRAAHPTRLVARTAQIEICAWIESNLLKQVPPCG